MRAGDADDVLHTKVAIGRTSFAAALACIAVLAIAPPQSRLWLIPAAQFALGLSLTTPKLGCYEAFATVYRTRGRGSCVVRIASCFLVAVLFQPLTALMSMGVAVSCAVIAALICASWAAWEGVVRCPALADPLGGAGGRRQDYRTSPYTKVLLLSFGLTWAFTFSTAVLAGFGGDIGHSVTWGMMVAGIGVNAAVIALFAFEKPMGGVRFGLMVRWVVAFVGSAWAAVPLLTELLPNVTVFLCSTVYVIQSMLMILFICEIAHEYGITVCTVTMRHYGPFIGAATVGAILYWALFTYLDATRALQVMSIVAVVASLAVIPALPSRSSKAAVFTLDELPEDDRYEDRAARAKETVAVRHGLTSRETEVLALIADGCSREEMADALSISPWTVKRHVSSIYEKTGVHSVRELMVLITNEN